jgi:hypothetical protein
MAGLIVLAVVAAPIELVVTVVVITGTAGAGDPQHHHQQMPCAWHEPENTPCIHIAMQAAIASCDLTSSRFIIAKLRYLKDIPFPELSLETGGTSLVDSLAYQPRAGWGIRWIRVGPYNLPNFNIPHNLPRFKETKQERDLRGD